jgi:hypothetical protein
MVFVLSDNYPAGEGAREPHLLRPSQALVIRAR